jgi:hypothetical protein
MAELGKLNLQQDVIGSAQSVADLPQQMGSYLGPLPVGPYVFALPPLSALKGCFDVIENPKELDQPVKQRLAYVFKEDAALTVVQAPRSLGEDRVKEFVGRQLRQRITNVARRRGKRDDPNAKSASDADYLLGALGETTLPARGDNAAYGKALLKYPSKHFGADIEYGWQCRDDKPIKVESEPDAAGNTQLITLDGTEGQAEQKGCGKRFYQNDVPKDADGSIPNRILCTCGATLFANENLVRFRKVTA